ncbi:Ribonuclease 3 [Psilocybe cubensis]|uniref:Uncharacterized protein n=2 Tax=Psilocybe cubensis TaxID=181762 RepID=A0A8H8CQE7_PSICU|nr:Ribonuclease 3 [Psilocybe cubensis]KAH9486480.1 Ribonuclease 3 [Psilocybe cubensis]
MSSLGHEGLPPIPKIDGDVDLMLDVFTHQSLRLNPVMNHDYGDSDRLAELGSKVLDMVVTYHLFSGRPLLTARDIEIRKAEVVSDENIDSWLKAYGLKEKLRISPDKVEVLQDPQELRKYFCTYIGALYIRNGLAVIQTWISCLIDPGVDVKLPDAASPSIHSSSPPPSHVGYQGSFSTASYSSPPSSQSSMGGFASPPPAPPVSIYAPQPSFPPPPLPGNPPTTVPSSMSLVTLALVNQTAAQKGLQVTYAADQVGPSHQPTWTVKCFINGVEYGRGIGKSQKIAKEEAAKQAWTTMGWGPS